MQNEWILASPDAWDGNLAKGSHLSYVSLFTPSEKSTTPASSGKASRLPLPEVSSPPSSINVHPVVVMLSCTDLVHWLYDKSWSFETLLHLFLSPDPPDLPLDR